MLTLLALQPSGRFRALNLRYLLVLAAFLVIRFAGRALENDCGLRTQVAAQKVIVYSAILKLALQALGVRRASGTRPR